MENGGDVYGITWDETEASRVERICARALADGRGISGVIQMGSRAVVGVRRGNGKAVAQQIAEMGRRDVAVAAGTLVIAESVLCASIVGDCGKFAQIRERAFKVSEGVGDARVGVVGVQVVQRQEN